MSIAFTFPGQGSQSLGMVSSFSEIDVVKEAFKEASDALGYDVWALCQSGPEASLNQTDKTQPALLTASVALWRHWNNVSELVPAVMAGHSLGEYSALVCAGVLSLSDGVSLVEARGKFMQQAVAEGSGKMAAIIGLDDALIREACAEAQQDDVVSAVNYNSPGQVVIAGNIDAVERAMVLCKEKGAKKAMSLSVSVPSHCALMKPAAEQLAERLSTTTFQSPKIDVINNVDVAIYQDADLIKEALVKQLHHPVRWTETIQKMSADGVESFLECGSGAVLTGLNKRISKQIKSFNLSTLDKFQSTLNELQS